MEAILDTYRYRQHPVFQVQRGVESVIVKARLKHADIDESVGAWVCLTISHYLRSIFQLYFQLLQTAERGESISNGCQVYSSIVDWGPSAAPVWLMDMYQDGILPPEQVS